MGTVIVKWFGLMMLHLHMNIGIKSKLIPVEYNEYRISECIKKRYIIILKRENADKRNHRNNGSMF